MIEFLFLPLFDPMIDRSNFRVLLDDGNSNPMINRLILGSILRHHCITVLMGSTNLRGKSPPVRLRTSLSVTSDFRLNGRAVFVGTWGKYFHTSSLIFPNYYRRNISFLIHIWWLYLFGEVIYLEEQIQSIFLKDIFCDILISNIRCKFFFYPQNSNINQSWVQSNSQENYRD